MLVRDGKGDIAHARLADGLQKAAQELVAHFFISSDEHAHKGIRDDLGLKHWGKLAEIDVALIHFDHGLVAERIEEHVNDYLTGVLLGFLGVPRYGQIHILVRLQNLGRADRHEEDKQDQKDKPPQASNQPQKGQTGNKGKQPPPDMAEVDAILDNLEKSPKALEQELARVRARHRRPPAKDW